ncbi:hypothetical protein ACXR2T_10205 [Leucobacter sp. HY1910]
MSHLRLAAADGELIPEELPYCPEDFTPLTPAIPLREGDGYEPVQGIPAF